ncbi:hypothetical protein [Okeania sp.]|nr:hypothetical protein [Okeania sp.]MEB3340246.1 hypothetical protein [Okeania sp.]
MKPSASYWASDRYTNISSISGKTSTKAGAKEEKNLVVARPA